MYLSSQPEILEYNSKDTISKLTPNPMGHVCCGVSHLLKLTTQCKSAKYKCVLKNYDLHENIMEYEDTLSQKYSDCIKNNVTTHKVNSTQSYTHIDYS